MSEDVDASLLDGPVDDLLIKHLPLFNQTRHEVIDVTNAGAIHPLFQYAPDVIVNRITFRRFNSSFMLHNFMQKFAHFLRNCWTVLRIKFLNYRTRITQSRGPLLSGHSVVLSSLCCYTLPENSLESKYARCFPLSGWTKRSLDDTTNCTTTDESQYSLKFQELTDVSFTHLPDWTSHQQDHVLFSIYVQFVVCCSLDAC